MGKIVNDKIILGAMTGFVGNAAKEAITWCLYWTGYLRYTIVHIAASYFVPLEFIDSPVSLMIGFLADWIIAWVFGVILLYLLKFTGKDYAILKGIGLGALFYLIVYGGVMALDLTAARLMTPLPNLLVFFSHVLLGAVCGWLLKRYAVSWSY